MSREKQNSNASDLKEIVFYDLSHEINLFRIFSTN